MCVQVDGRVRVRACHAHSLAACARTYEKIRSTGVDLISVRAKRYNTKSILKRQGRAKIRSTQVDLIFVRARARGE